jgi:osmotically inducible protein OsmC
MPVRSAKAVWKGNLREGNGTASFGGFEGRYSFPSRFEEGEGTNPEEMIGAAFAACFSMALSAELGRAGFEPDEVRTEARVHIEKDGAGFSITRIDLNTEARVPGIDDALFQEQAGKAKAGCPVSRALAVADIRLDAKLV